MKATRLGTLAILAGGLISFDCELPPSFSRVGDDVPRPGLCRVTSTQVAKTGAPPPLGSTTANEGVSLELCRDDIAQGLPGGTPCSCEDYIGQYDGYPPPPELLMSIPAPFEGGVDDGLTTGVFDTHVTRICNGPNCTVGMPIEGCTCCLDGDVVFAWPDCAETGQVSGTVTKTGPFSADGFLDPGNDDDYTINLCPEAMSVLLPNGTWMPKDLRELRNFYGAGGQPGDKPVGFVHIEVQGCRFYDGTYQILDPGTTTLRSYPSRPQVGDMMTAAGDWVFDHYHEDHDGPQAGWDEIHEARIIATARRAPVPVDGSVSYVFVSSTFVNNSNQQDHLELQAKVPAPTAAPPAGSSWQLVTCEIDPTFPGVAKRPACDLYPFGAVHVTVFPDMSACQVQVDRPTPPDTLSTFNRNSHNYECVDTCDGNDFTEPDDCNQLGYVGVIRATWATVATAASPQIPSFEDGSAPGDLWMCNNCACGDPGSITPFAAPVMGCASSGLDPTSASAQQQACAQACGGSLFTGAQSGLSNICSPPLGTSSARLIGRNACVPTAHGDPFRPTTAADYHVKLTPYNPATQQGSSVTFTIAGNTAANIPVDGQVAVNTSSVFQKRKGAMASILDIADLELNPHTFSIAGMSISGLQVFIAQRLWAERTTSTTFTLPARGAVFGVRGMVNGSQVGDNEENVLPASGTFDPNTRTFSMDISTQDVDQNNQQRTMVAHLVGTVDNVPPSAVITGATSTLECGASQTLSAGSSGDPDGGGISRFQWLIDGRSGGTQDHLSVQSKKLGNTSYDLRVYDASFAASHAQARINVVDTTPPKLVLPASVTTHVCATTGIVTVGQATATDACTNPTVSGSVVSLNGVALNPPIPVVAGQVTLGIGTYKILWTASDGVNQSQGTQTVVVGGGFETSRSFIVDDRASVRTSGGTPAAVLNAGTGATSIGNDAISGSILSVGSVTVLDRAHVGGITSGGSVTVSSTAVVGGPIIRQSTQIVLPALPTLPSFPTAQAGFTLNSGSSRTLQPGSYGAVVLNAGSTLVLLDGDYFFHDLTVNATVTLRATSKTRVFVQATMAYRSSITNTSGQLQAITLGFVGTAVTLEAPLNGTLIAPNASVTFGVDTALTFSGTFFGKTFEVRPQSILNCL